MEQKHSIHVVSQVSLLLLVCASASVSSACGRSFAEVTCLVLHFLERGGLAVWETLLEFLFNLYPLDKVRASEVVMTHFQLPELGLVDALK